MLVAVNGYFDGTAITIDESDKKAFTLGDRVIVTLLNNKNSYLEDRTSKRRQMLKSRSCVIKTNRTLEEIDEEIRSGRSERF